MSFPNTPSAGTTHTIGDITWEWNGYAWEVVVSTIGGVSGPRGNTGATGVGISGTTLTNYELIITYTNGITQNVGYIRGDTGAPGTPGAAGTAGTPGNTGNTGIGISGAVVSDNNLIITRTDGTTLNAGNVRGATGPTGATGDAGRCGNPSGLYRIFGNPAENVVGITIGEIRFLTQTAGQYRIAVAQNSVSNVSEKGFIDTWDDSTSSVKSTFAIKNRIGNVYGIGSLSQIFELATAGVTYYDVYLNRLTTGVTFNTLGDLFIDVFRTGDCGSAGPIGPQGDVGRYNGLPYTFIAGQTSNFQSFGYLSFNSNSGATYIYITDKTTIGGGASGYINTFDDSTNTHKGYLHISATGSDKIHIYNLTGLSYFTGGTYFDGESNQNYENYFRLNVTPSYTGGITFSDGISVSVSFIRTGDAGIQGNTGATGTAGSGGGAAGTKTYAVFTPLLNEPPSATFATIDTRNSISVLDFDGTTAEGAVFRSIMPEGASFSSLVAYIWAMATTAVTGDVIWGVQYEDMNGQDLDSDGFSTGITKAMTIAGVSGQPVGITIGSTFTDGITAGDPYRVKIYRAAAEAGDTMVGDAELLSVEIRGA